MATLIKGGEYEIILTLYRKIRYQESLKNRFFKTFLRESTVTSPTSLYTKF